MMEAKDSARRAIDGLIELVVAHASLAAASRQLGKKRNYFSRVRERGSIEWGTFFRALDTYGVDHARLAQWSGSLARYPVLEQLGTDAMAIAIRREPTAAKTIRAAYLRGELTPSPISEDQDARLTELDTLRHDDTVAAEARAAEAITTASSPAVAARALGIWASALRATGALEDAKVVLWTAMRIAATEGFDAELGALAQRAVYVLADEGSFEAAVATAETACTIHEPLGDADRFGRALVDLGMARFHCGQGDRETCFSRALDRLDDDSVRYRSAALHALSVIKTQNGALTEADALAVRALDCAPPSAHFRARALWLRARLARAHGDHLRAVRLYRDALQLFGQREPIDVALLGAELVRALATLGELAAATTLASALRWTTIPLEAKAPRAAAAIVRLIVASQEVDTFERHARQLAARVERAVIATAGDRGVPTPATVDRAG